MATDARLRLIEARQRLRDLRNPAYGLRHVLAGDASGNVALPGTDLVMARVSATGRPILVMNPTRRVIEADEALEVYPTGEWAPAGWYVPGVILPQRVCSLYTSITDAQYLLSPAWVGVFNGLPNQQLEFENAFFEAIPFFGLRMLNGTAYVHEVYSGNLVAFAPDGTSSTIVKLCGHPRWERNFSGGADIIPLEQPLTGGPMHFDIDAAHGRIYFATLTGSGLTVADSIYSCNLFGGDVQLIATTGTQVWTSGGRGTIFVAYSAYDDAVYWGWNQLNSALMVIRKYQSGVVSIVGGLATEAGPTVGESVLNKTLLGGRLTSSIPSTTTDPWPYAVCDPFNGRLYWMVSPNGTKTIHCIDRNGIYLGAGTVFNSPPGPFVDQNFAKSLAISRLCNRVTVASYDAANGDGILRSGFDPDTGESGANQNIFADMTGNPDAIAASFHAMDAGGDSDTFWFYPWLQSGDDLDSYSGGNPSTIGYRLRMVS